MPQRWIDALIRLRKNIDLIGRHWYSVSLSEQLTVEMP
jgi:hypothetical protein